MSRGSGVGLHAPHENIAILPALTTIADRASKSRTVRRCAGAYGILNTRGGAAAPSNHRCNGNSRAMANNIDAPALYSFALVRAPINILRFESLNERMTRQRRTSLTSKRGFSFSKLPKCRRIAIIQMLPRQIKILVKISNVKS